MKIFGSPILSPALTATLLTFSVILPPSLQAEEVVDKGNFKVSYTDAEDETLGTIASILKESKLFDAIASELNEGIILPHNIPIVFEACGQANAFYNPEEKKISMCYELFADFVGMFGADENLSDDQVGDRVLEGASFILVHEVGHALVHIYDLPITGKEEDAVDDLAGLIWIGLGEEGTKVLSSAVESFALLAEREGYEELAFYDEHSLSGQRVYSVACMILGSDPEKFSDMVGEDGIPEARAARCPGEFQQKSRSWAKLLGPYLKELKDKQ